MGLLYGNSQTPTPTQSSGGLLGNLAQHVAAYNAQPIPDSTTPTDTSSVPTIPYKKIPGTTTPASGFFNKIGTYARAFETSPGTALSRVITGQGVQRVDNGAIISARMPLAQSQKIKAGMGGNTVNGQPSQLDHVVPLELGGTNQQKNLKNITAAQDNAQGVIENYLGQALKGNLIDAKTAQNLMSQYKNGQIDQNGVFAGVKANPLQHQNLLQKAVHALGTAVGGFEQGLSSTIPGRAVFTPIGETGKAVGQIASIPYNAGKAAIGQITNNPIATKNATDATNRDINTAESFAQFVPRALAQVRQSAAHAISPNNPSATGFQPNTPLERFFFGKDYVPTLQQTYASDKQQHGTPSAIATTAAQAFMDLLVAHGVSKSAVKGIETGKVLTGNDAALTNTINNAKVQSLAQAVSKAQAAKASGNPLPASALDAHVAQAEQLAKDAQKTAPTRGNAPSGAILDKNYVKPTDTTAPTPKTNVTQSNEAGFVDPIKAVTDVKSLIDKHNETTNYGNDLQHAASASEGNKQIILKDAAGVLKNRESLSNADKQALQDFRDAKAAGLKPTPLPDHLKAEDVATTELNKAAQLHDAELARLNGQEQKAQSILARDPSTYTHRVAQGKGGAYDYLLQGDRKSPLSTSKFGKSKPGDKSRVYQSITDEQGNRSVVAIKHGEVTALDNGATHLGTLKLKTNETLMNKELRSTESKIANLEHEKSLLTATKGRSAASPQRIVNINKNLLELNRKHAEISNKYDMNNYDKKIFTGSDGKKYTIGQATQSEITKATGQKYYTDPKLNALTNYVESRTALENARFMESIKSDPRFSDFVSPPDKTAPKGWKSVPGFDQFRGYKFEPKTADTIKDILRTSANEKDALDKVGKVLRQTIVYFPVKHDLNMVAAYIADRGISKLASPFATKRAVSSMYQAIHEVINQEGPVFTRLQKSGFSLPSADTKEFEKAFKGELDGLVGNKEAMKSVARQIGSTPKRLIDAYNKFQHVSVWELQDILNTARVIERMKPTLLSKGASFEDAMKQTERFNFQYKVPSRVAGSRSASRMLRSDKVFFGRYRYDQWKILSNTIKDSVNIKHPAQAAQAWDKLAVLAIGTSLVMPLVNKGVQALSGNPNAYVTAPGPLDIPEKVYQILKGQKGMLTTASGQLYLGPLQSTLDIKNNHDSFTGKQIYDPNSSVVEQAKQIGDWVKSQIAPVQKAGSLKNTSGTNPLNIILGLAGVSFPKNSPLSNKLNSLKFDSLPSTQAQAKAQAKSGDFAGANDTIAKYDQKVLAAAKADLQAKGESIPSDQELIKQLKKSGYYYSPQNKTIQGWSQPKKPIKGGFTP